MAMASQLSHLGALLEPAELARNEDYCRTHPGSPSGAHSDRGELSPPLPPLRLVHQITNAEQKLSTSNYRFRLLRLPTDPTHPIPVQYERTPMVQLRFRVHNRQHSALRGPCQINPLIPAPGCRIGAATL